MNGMLCNNFCNQFWWDVCLISLIIISDFYIERNKEGPTDGGWVVKLAMNPIWFLLHLLVGEDK